MATLITGASGYVGSHLQAVLTEQERNNCLTPDLDEFELADAACVDRYFAEHSVDQVIHLAACLDSSAPASLFISNIEGMLNLLSASIKYNVSYFLFISGNNVYGANGDRKFIEGDKRNPLSGNRYGLSKYCGELMIADYLAQTNTRYGILRIADIYGPGQKTGALLKAITTNMKEGQPQRLYGVGDRTRDYIYIDDVAQGIAFAARKKLEGIYNLSTGVGTSVADLVHMAEEISSCKEPTIPVAVEKEDHSKVVLDNSKLKQAGFAPSVTIAEGLRRLAE